MSMVIISKVVLILLCTKAVYSVRIKQTVNRSVQPSLPTCSGIRVEHCSDCRGAFACNKCYKVMDEINAPTAGTVCADSLVKSDCQGSDSITAWTQECKVVNTRSVTRPSSPSCPSDLLDKVVAAQQLPSVPDNTFDLCKSNAIKPDVGVLSIVPVIKKVPFVITTAVEWLLFAGGYTGPYENGTATIGNSATDVPFRKLSYVQYLPDSDPNWIAHPDSGLHWIAYTTHMAPGVTNPTKLIVYCHGNFESAINIISGKFDALAMKLNAKIVAFEYPGYGGVALGQSTITSVKYATMAGLNWARQMWGWDSKDILIIGRSIGTGVAAEAAASYERAGTPLGGLILISPYSSIQKLVTGFVGGFSLAGSWATESWYFQTSVNVGRMKRTPTLIAHGDKDDIIPVSHAEEIALSGKASGMVTYERMKNIGHNNLSIDRIMKTEKGANWLDAFASVPGNGQGRAFTEKKCVADALLMCPTW